MKWKHGGAAPSAKTSKREKNPDLKGTEKCYKKDTQKKKKCTVERSWLGAFH